MTTHDLLIEIGIEEMPAAQLKPLSQQFSELITAGLVSLKFAHGPQKIFATPRRLCVIIDQVESHQSRQTMIRRGPALEHAYDSQGQPTKATLGFLKGLNQDVSKLQTQATEKGSWVYVEQNLEGKFLFEFLAELIQESLTKLNSPKKMFWGTHKNAFIRPIKWITIFYENHQLKDTIYGLTPIQHTYGHRFHHPQAIPLSTAASYEAELHKGHVIAQWDKRRQIIAEGLNSEAKKRELILAPDPELIDEVTGLTEWPVPLIGRFDEQFLTMPAEILTTSMRSHQRCFSLYQGAKLSAHFGIVAGLSSSNPSIVIKGNERVMHARLKDALFYFQKDLETPHTLWENKLSQVVFQQGLGSLTEKTERLSKLAKHFASSFGLDTDKAELSASLCKLDLMSHVVNEFPELQGIMGEHYLKNQGVAHEICQAVREHYQPRFSKDSLASSALGLLLSLCDRADTLVGLFGIQKAPKADKDPFGLRRLAIGLIRILIENKINIDLKELFTIAQNNYTKALPNNEHIEQLINFCFERFKHYALDKNSLPRTVDSVTSLQLTNPFDVFRRLKAVEVFQQNEANVKLCAANKRVANILRPFGLHQGSVHAIETAYLIEPAELKLYERLVELNEPIKALVLRQDYEQILLTLSQMREPIDNFFDTVMVNCDNEFVRQNRIRLLHFVRQLFLTVADIAKL